jgi:nucleobase:cation symporter-1, NCS1 family
MTKYAIEQTTPEERIFSYGSFIWLWFGMTAQMGVFMLGASFAFKIEFWDALAAILIGNFVVSILLVLNGDPGSKYGIKFAVFLKSCFGYWGYKIPAIARALAATCWFGIQTFFAAKAIDLSIMYLTGYTNWFMWFIIFGVFQIFLTYMGVTWIKWLQNIAAPALFILSIWLIYFLLNKDPDNGWEQFVTADLRTPLPFWAALTANLSFWVTVAINISDFTRHIKTGGAKANEFIKRNRISIIGQMPGITIGMTVFVMVGMVGAYFTGHGNPVEIVNASLGGAWVLLGLFIILLAQLSTNTAANLFATANVIAVILRPWGVDYKKGVIIAGVIGMFTMPWYLVEHFLTYLPFLGALLAPLPAIMVTDYYIIRKGKLSIPDLFDSEGKYKYWHNFNPAAMIAYAAGVAAGCAFLKGSWLIALPVSFLVYYFLTTLWTMKAYPEAYTDEGIDDAVDNGASAIHDEEVA